jgi:hypothetical protein
MVEAEQSKSGLRDVSWQDDCKSGCHGMIHEVEVSSHLQNML